MRAQPAPLGPKPSPGATATRVSARIRSGVSPSGRRHQTKNVESARVPGSAADDLVASALVDRAALLDRLLRPGQRGDARRLDRPEDARAHVVSEQVEPLDELGVPDDEAEPPAGHAVGLRHGEHLRADLPRARLGEEARRPPSVELEVGVGEVVEDERPRPLRPAHGLREDARRRRGRARVRRVVEVERGRALASRELRREVRRPGRAAPAPRAPRRARRRRCSPGSRDRGAGSSRPARRGTSPPRRSPSSSPARPPPRARGRARRRRRRGSGRRSPPSARGCRGRAGSRAPSGRSPPARPHRSRAGAARCPGCRDRGRRPRRPPAPPRRRPARAARAKYCSGRRSIRSGCGRTKAMLGACPGDFIFPALLPMTARQAPCAAQAHARHLQRRQPSRARSGARHERRPSARGRNRRHPPLRDGDAAGRDRTSATRSSAPASRACSGPSPRTGRPRRPGRTPFTRTTAPATTPRTRRSSAASRSRSNTASSATTIASAGSGIGCTPGGPRTGAGSSTESSSTSPTGSRPARPSPPRSASCGTLPTTTL